MPTTNWYLIFTRSNCEQKVVDNLLKRGIEYYCPYNKVVSITGIRRKIIYKPLFTSYVFVRLNASLLEEVTKIDGVVNLLYWLDKPVVIRDIEVEMIRRFLNEHDNVQLEKTRVNVNEVVKLTSSAICENDGSNNDGSNMGESAKIVKLLLPSLGYSLFAEVNTEKVGILLKDDLVHYNSSPIENTIDFGL